MLKNQLKSKHKGMEKQVTFTGMYFLNGAYFARSALLDATYFN